ncbi:MAG: D-tyrosyl-tRNA(Tyr) deacylase [Candidatus Peregrinibacteria bacterium]|nr:D-tyrosyl-tRNA(Tyr) deacylase [Candidatus Peregrinibacteria bacterium]MCB9808192.1 D-tyrosyl-tRNA(Tyr) deacylase [Candidatus Peribacteria bacterium]
MRILLQKVTDASVAVHGDIVGQIGIGYLLFLGVLHGDTSAQAELLAEKIVKLRLFDGEDGKINDRSILDTNGEILVVSQFTLAGRTEKGNRPDYTQAADPESAGKLYEYFVRKLESLGVQRVETGEFGAHMDVMLHNDGPVTLILEK